MPDMQALSLAGAVIDFAWSQDSRAVQDYAECQANRRRAEFLALGRVGIGQGLPSHREGS